MAVSIVQTANPAGVSASGSTITYSNVSIGTASSDRIIVVLFAVELTSCLPLSCTINGTSMTAIASFPQFGALSSHIFYLNYPSNTTANIVVTVGGGSPTNTQNHIAVYAVYGGVYSSYGNDTSTDMDTSDPLTTGSITIPTDGGFIAVAAGATDTNAKTWTNATKDIDIDAGAFRFTTAYRTTALTSTAITCYGTSNGEDGVLSYLIFSPSPNVTISTSSQQTTLSQLNPTISTTQNVTVSTSSITLLLSLLDPAIDAFISVYRLLTPDGNQILVGEYVNQVLFYNYKSTNVTASVSTQTASLSLLSPTISTQSNITVQPSSQTTTLTQLAPNILTASNAIVQPSAQTANFSLLSPTITTTSQVTVLPNKQEALLALQNPTILAYQNTVVSLDYQQLNIALLGPSVIAVSNVTIIAEKQEISLTQLSPVISAEGGITVQPDKNEANLNQLSPTISTIQNLVVDTSLQETNLSLLEPSVIAGQNTIVEAGIQEINSSQLSPVIGIGIITTLDKQTVLISPLDVQISAVQNVVVSLDAVSIDSSLLTATVVTGTHITIGADTQTADLSLLSPTVITAQNATIIPDTQTITATAISPNIFIPTDEIVEVSTITLTTNQIDPIVSIGIQAEVSNQDIAISLLTPTVSTSLQTQNIPITILSPVVTTVRNWLTKSKVDSSSLWSGKTKVISDGWNYKLKTDDSDLWSSKNKIKTSQELGRILTYDGSQILVGENVDEILIYQEYYDYWTRKSKNNGSNNWIYKTKIGVL